MSFFTGVRRHWEVFWAAWGEERAKPKQKTRNKKELEFLPAALEVLETPPSPIGLGMLWLIIVIFVVALTWSWFGQIDIVATASGKIVPTERTKLIQPLETAVVRAIHVTDGQAVQAGDVLIELDPTETGADVDRLRRDEMTAGVEVARLTAMIDRADELGSLPSFATGLGEADFAYEGEVDPAILRVQRSLMASLEAEQIQRLAATDQEIQRLDASAERAVATIERLEATVPLIRQREKAQATLVQKELLARSEYLRTAQELAEATGQLAEQRHGLRETAAALEGAKRERQQAIEEYRRTRLGELAEAEARLNTATQETIKAETRATSRLLRAPEDGVVQQLKIFTVGGVVTPAQELMVIVPADSQLEVEAMIENKDIGFIDEGQVAEVKIETFAFTRYGVIDAEVKTVSRDAIPDEDRGLVYAARIALSTDVMNIRGREIRLSPGMAVSAEIKTGKRRVLEYILDPVLRATSEAMRER